MLVDAGGGNGILTQLEQSGIEFRSIQNLFITHTHTDHILGAVWIMRMALQFHYPLHVWSHSKAIDLLRVICEHVLPPKDLTGIGNNVILHELEDGDEFQVADLRLQCFDIHSTKGLQYGLVVVFPNNIRLCCLGDEPYNPLCVRYAKNADYLMSEAFCLYEDRDLFRPYEKHHSTVLDSARIAQDLHVNTLILYHTEDRTLDSRCRRYTAEAKTVFNGKIIVPDDLEKIAIGTNE